MTALSDDVLRSIEQRAVRREMERAINDGSILFWSATIEGVITTCAGGAPHDSTPLGTSVFMSSHGAAFLSARDELLSASPEKRLESVTIKYVPGCGSMNGKCCVTSFTLVRTAAGRPVRIACVTIDESGARTLEGHRVAS